MTKKGSMMGASKYEFNPEQFEIDVENNIKRYKNKKDSAKQEIIKILESDPTRLDESFSMVLEILREIKEKYKL